MVHIFKYIFKEQKYGKQIVKIFLKKRSTNKYDKWKNIWRNGIHIKRSNMKIWTNCKIFFENIKEKVASGQELWSTYSNNYKFVDAFKKYLNNQYGINFEAKNDKDARYTLGALPDNYKGGKYKRSKKRNGWQRNSEAYKSI